MKDVSDIGYAYQPDVHFPAGDLLAEWLQRRGMSQAQFARRAALSTKHVNQVLSGTAGLSAEVAVAFEKVTGIPTRFWMQLESNHRAFEAQRQEATALEGKLGILDQFPVKQLVARGAIEHQASPVDQLRELLKFFGVANITALEDVWLAPTALRTSKAYTPNHAALAAWLRIAELEAEHIDTEPFDAEHCAKALEEFRSLTRIPGTKWVEQLGQRCAAVGIALVIVKELPGSRINGATRWLSPSKAMIALSLRHRRHDILWFTFFHELGHLLRHGKRRLFIDAEGTGIDQDLELDADRFATRILIPPSDEGELPHLGTPAEVEAFATRIGIHPSLVVGRMQHERLIPYNRWNQLIPKYRFHDDH